MPFPQQVIAAPHFGNPSKCVMVLGQPRRAIITHLESPASDQGRRPRHRRSLKPPKIVGRAVHRLEDREKKFLLLALPLALVGAATMGRAPGVRPRRQTQLREIAGARLSQRFRDDGNGLAARARSGRGGDARRLARARAVGDYCLDAPRSRAAGEIYSPSTSEYQSRYFVAMNRAEGFDDHTITPGLYCRRRS